MLSLEIKSHEDLTAHFKYLKRSHREWGRDLFSLLLKTLTSWKESYDQLRQHIKKQRHYFANKGSSSQGYGFSQWSCMDVRAGL